jgi:squalene-associated FAD-dependent desaturase
MAEGRLAVVGAGLAGLAAAVELKKRGYSVDLFERSRLVGGKATSFEVDGIEVDNGQHVFLACCHQFISFIQDLGMAIGDTSTDRDPVYLQPRFEALLLTKSGPAVRLSSRNLPPPFHLLPSLLAARQLGIMGRAQVALALLAMHRGPLPGETFGRWLSRHRQGINAISGFWDPFVVPALNAGIDEVSAADAAFVIRTAFLEDRDGARFGYSRIPLAHLARHALSRLNDVHLRTSVKALRASEQNASGSVEIEVANGRRDRFDGVVLAIPPARLKALTGSPKSFGIFGLDQFRHAPIVDVHLWFDVPPRTLLGDMDFAALLDSPIQWVFEKSAPSGETYLACSMSAASCHVGESKEALIEMAHRELQSRLPALQDAKLIRGAATRDRDATFVPSIGLVRPGATTSWPRVTIAGAWTDTGWPATMESAVRSGRTAAEALHDAIAA